MSQSESNGHERTFDDSSDTLSISTTYTHKHLDFDGDKEPNIGDFVLAKFVTENSVNSYHYVAEVIDKDDTEFVVSFFRQSMKCPGKFVKPATQ